MKNLIIGMTLVGVVGVIGWFFFSSSQTPEVKDDPNNPSQTLPVGSGSTMVPPVYSEEGIKELVKDKMTDMPLVRFSETTVVDNYALQLWSDENIGGEALLFFSNDLGWTVVSLGGGAWDKETLIAQGVPAATAAGLVANRGY